MPEAVQATTADNFRETAVPLLRPDQVEANNTEMKRLRAIIDAPPWVDANRGQAKKDYMRLQKQMAAEAPKPYEGPVLDAARAREKQLAEKISLGMPTDREMRRAPVGSVDKHKGWERRNKPSIMEWKNIRRRLHMSGAIPEFPDADAIDVANVELLRPTDATHELMMHGEMIPRPTHLMPPPGAAPATVLDEREIKVLNEVDPTIAKGLALLDNEDRAKVKDFVSGLLREEPTIDDGKPKPRKKAN